MKFSLILRLTLGFVNFKKSLSSLPQKRSKKGCFSSVHTLETPSHFQNGFPSFAGMALKPFCDDNFQRLVFS
jgi:hypothetical protein